MSRFGCLSYPFWELFGWNDKEGEDLEEHQCLCEWEQSVIVVEGWEGGDQSCHGAGEKARVALSDYFQTTIAIESLIGEKCRYQRTHVGEKIRRWGSWMDECGCSSLSEG